MKNPESYWSYSLPGPNVNGFNSLPIETQFRSVVHSEDVLVPPIHSNDCKKTDAFQAQ